MLSKTKGREGEDMLGSLRLAKSASSTVLFFFSCRNFFLGASGRVSLLLFVLQ